MVFKSRAARVSATSIAFSVKLFRCSARQRWTSVSNGSWKKGRRSGDDPKTTIARRRRLSGGQQQRLLSPAASVIVQNSRLHSRRAVLMASADLDDQRNHLTERPTTAIVIRHPTTCGKAARCPASPPTASVTGDQSVQPHRRSVFMREKKKNTEDYLQKPVGFHCSRPGAVRERSVVFSLQFSARLGGISTRVLEDGRHGVSRQVARAVRGSMRWKQRIIIAIVLTSGASARPRSRSTSTVNDHRRHPATALTLLLIAIIKIAGA